MADDHLIHVAYNLLEQSVRLPKSSWAGHYEWQLSFSLRDSLLDHIKNAESVYTAEARLDEMLGIPIMWLPDESNMITLLACETGERWTAILPPDASANGNVLPDGLRG